MRITYIHQYFNTPAMPGGTRSYEMARRLVARGHEVDMVTSYRESTEKSGWFETEEAGIRVHWLPVPYSNRMGFAERIRAFVKFAVGASRKAASLSGDVVFATSTPLTIAIPGVYGSKRRNVPMVFEVRDLWPAVPIALGALKSKPLIAAARRLERFAYKNASRIVALAPGMKDGVVRTGYPEGHVEVIPNGCDLDLFQQASGNSDALLTEHGIPLNMPLVAYIGTIGEVNDVEYIVRLAAELDSRNEKITFVIIGDGKNASSVKQLAQDLGVLDRRVFMVGRIAKREVPKWLRASKATIMTYNGPEVVYRDSVSNKFFDSLAASRPVFANFSGFSTQAAQSTGAGLILSRDVTQAAPRLAEHVTNDAWLQTASREALQLARERFSRDQLARQLEKVLQEAVSA